MTRDRIFLAGTAALYAGPLVSALGGNGGEGFWAFLAIFVLWHLAVRGERLPPRDVFEVVRLASGIATLAALIGLAMGLGALLHWPLGMLHWPASVGIVLSALSVPVCRLSRAPLPGA